jgi:predicted transcriptional regulator
MLYYGNMGNKVSYTFRFDTELIEQVDKQGTKENRSRTNMIEVMIMNYLHRYSSSPDSGYQDTPKSLA